MLFGVIIILLLLAVADVASVLCSCLCPNYVGNATGSVCGAQACATACYNRYVQCTTTTTLGCCGYTQVAINLCGSYPSSNNCNCFCQRATYSTSFLGTTFASAPTYGAACARACFTSYSSQCPATQIRGCTNSYASSFANGCSYYQRNYTCDCICPTYQGTTASDICSGSECARVCYTAYLGCGYSSTRGCTVGCGPQACRNYTDLARSTYCYCNCPSRIGTTWANSCAQCTSTCMEDFPQCQMNNATSWGSCSSSMISPTTPVQINITGNPQSSLTTSKMSSGARQISYLQLSYTLINLIGHFFLLL